MAESSVTPGETVYQDVSLQELILDLPIAQELRKLITKTPICPEDLMQGIDDCALEEIPFLKKEASKSSEGQRVLILDEGKFPLAYTRYHKRILDFIEPDEQGWYRTIQRPLSLPRNLKEIFKDVLGDKYPNLSVAVLKLIFASGLDQEIDQKFQAAMDSVFIGQLHGALVMALIAEYSPQAEMVIAETFDLTKIPDFCQIGLNNEAIVSFGRYLDQAVASLQDVIAEHQIHWINYSAGNSRKTLDHDAIRKCSKVFSDQTAKLILQTLVERFYNPLSSISGVLFVQAGLPHLPDTNLAEDPNFVTDCISLPQRLRVSVFTASKEHLLPPLGANRFDLLDHNQKTKWPCVDSYVNIRYKQHTESDSKYDDDQTILRLTNGWNDFGLYHREDAAGSFAAPVVVSHLIHRKKNDFPDLSNEDFLLNAEYKSRGKLIDPARYQAFEAFRLKILPITKCEIVRVDAYQRNLLNIETLQELRQTQKAPILNSDRTQIVNFFTCSH